MGADSKIEWCDHTFNPWIGCTKVAPGCTHCYAEAFAKRYGKAAWGPQGTHVKTSEAYWRKPLKWNRDASFRKDLGDEIEQNTGQRPDCYAHRPRVFCASLADVFEDWRGTFLHSRADSHGSRMELSFDTATGRYSQWKPTVNAPTERLATMDDLRRDLFALIDRTPHLDWLLLTKRPENVRRMWASEIYQQPTVMHAPIWRKNVWLGCSVSDQATANANLPELYALYDLCPIIFVSAEPLLGPIVADPKARTKPDWVIIGGESGHGARPCNIEWIRSLLAQCKAAGVPAFVKQLGGEPRDAAVAGWPDGTRFETKPDRHGVWQPTQRVKLNDKKGGDITAWPVDLRVREFPDTSITQLGATP